MNGMLTKFNAYLLITIAALTFECGKLAAGADEGSDIADQGYEMLKTWCYRCHGQRMDVEGFNVLNHETLTEKVPEEDVKSRYIVAGHSDQSLIWQRAGVRKDMPPGENAMPSAAELEILQKWIDAGAPFPIAEVRRHVSEKEIFVLMHRDLNAMAREDRRFQRYFTLTNLHNNSYDKRVGSQGKNFDTADLRLARAALAKLVNSLSWEHEIVVPRIVDQGQEEVLLAVDVRDLGWDERQLWNEILKLYPYGLTYDTVSADEEFREIARQVYELTGSKVPAVRVDWFIDTASRPPLYHTVLGLPEQVSELEKLLRVDPAEDFLRDKLVRAGFAGSGVSRNNRLVDRHPALYGAYWKSYDFAKSETTGNIFQFPLGPRFENNPFDRNAFEHAGGEMIFNLPNGLQGYLLTDSEGVRIDKGPVEIVRDLKETSGTPEVLNGLSCMACHEHGVIRFKDSVREGSAVFGDARLKLQRLFIREDTMDKYLDKDEQRFMDAAAEAMQPFLLKGEVANANQHIKKIPEPIATIARYYQKDLELDDVAAELGFADPQELRTFINANIRLRGFGLAPLLQGDTIKRSLWQTLEKPLSPFQQSALEMQIGTPHRSL